MVKARPNKPILICVYGFPGAGKSFTARNLANDLGMAHVSAERLRGELFDRPEYTAREEAAVVRLMNYMTGAFLEAGVSAVYDINAVRVGQRRALRALAHRHQAEYLLLWLQIDQETALARHQNRDRRTADDKFAVPHTTESFSYFIGEMQNPESSEEYLVLSGKHGFAIQKSAIISRLYKLGLISGELVQANITKPELVNLIPAPAEDRVDLSRRNITING